MQDKKGLPIEVAQNHQNRVYSATSIFWKTQVFHKLPTKLPQEVTVASQLKEVTGALRPQKTVSHKTYVLWEIIGILLSCLKHLWCKKSINHDILEPNVLPSHHFFSFMWWESIISCSVTHFMFCYWFLVLSLISCFVTHFLFALFRSGLKVRIKGPD